MPIKRGIKPIAQNRKARHDYYIEDVLECGVELFGTEVKSLRKGMCNLKDSYAQVKNGELFVIGMHISPYEQGNIFNKDPFRTRKLLAHKSEIRRLAASAQQDGMSLIPLSTLRTGGPRWRSPSPKAKSSTTNAIRSRNETRDAKWKDD